MVVREINEQYLHPIEPGELVTEAIERMLARLDPYTEFYTEEQTADLDILLQGKYVGVGIRMGTIDSMLTITSVTDGSSAHRAGVRVGDIVLKIDSVTITQQSATHARKYLRGPCGTVVRLELLRGEDTITVALRREEIIVRNVSYAGFAADDVGLIRLERFSRRAPEEFRQSLDSMRMIRPLRGLIIDVRDNPGGLLDAAVSIAEMFLPPGDTIVTTKGRNGNNQRVYVARAMPYVDTTVPVVVLVNNQSASASEILAGALQDNDRAVIMGDTTLGKGLVQTVISLPYNAALKLTTAQYYTPSGRSIQQTVSFCPNCWIHRAIDTSHHSFLTSRYHRTINGGGGIIPDTILSYVDQDSIPPAIGRSVIWNFATLYASRLQAPPARLEQQHVLASLAHYLDKTQAERYSVLGKVFQLLNQARQDKWGGRAAEHIERLAQFLRAERIRLLRENARVIAAAVEQEVQARFLSDRQKVMRTLTTDPAVRAAVDMLRTAAYRKYLVSAHGAER
ncbi:MAG: S41 family peptidase [Candidatus Kapabacteria bacterium]|nr:S41 family peptidase [Candidatus Kapabacteria bacterium]MCS7302037.1 S41 family peptidase [Candidatus Kapabacteria bacterium]MCX7936837.1 S41 family peptidase [Chlorobiota bacterium]